MRWTRPSPISIWCRLKGKKKIVYTDFEDELGSEITIDLPEVVAGMDMAKFRDKARQFLKTHENHVSLQRLRRNHVQYLTENGVMEPDRLYDSPFTDISPQGPEGIFLSSEVDKMVEVLIEIRQRAAA